MGIVSHGYGGFVGGRNEGGCLYACWTKPGGTSRVRGDTLMTPDYTAVLVRSSG